MTKRVKRQSGEWVDFDIDKLRYSLSKSGASEIEIGEVLERLIPQIHASLKRLHVE